MIARHRLRGALADLADAAGPLTVTPAEVAALASQLRARRRARAAIASCCVLLALGGVLASGAPQPSGLVVVPNPGSSPMPGPSGTPGAATPPAGPAGPAGPAYTPGSPNPSEPAASPSPAAPSPAPPSPVQPSPAPAPTDGGKPPAYRGPPSCNLVKDGSGDVGGLATGPLDVLSADVAGGDSTVAAIVRVRDVDEDSPQPQGVTWAFGWRFGDFGYEFVAHRDAFGATTGKLVVTDRDSGAVTEHTDVTVTFPPEKSAVQWTAPRGHVREPGDGTAWFGDLRAYTGRGPAGPDAAADTASTNARYPAGNRSCLAAA